MNHTLYTEALDMASDLTTWRRALHRMPELGLALPRTGAFVQEKLSEMGVPFQVLLEGSCIVAVLGSKGPCFLLRSDMDGLPIQEETGLDFAADNGRMHACGHDMHTAVLLGAARLLKRHENTLRGTVKLLFQPGEETFSGARAAIQAGVLENPKVDAAFAMHVASAGSVGVFAYGNRPMSSVYGFQITITGVGGHGSMPETCIDPITAGVHIHLALQELIARECAASDEAVLTIGQFQAGNAANVIPGQAVLQGTLRTFSNAVSQRLVSRIGEVVSHVAAAYRTKAEISTLSMVPGVVCDPELNQEICSSIRSLSPDFIMRDTYHVMGSEDFAFFSEALPKSSYFALGAGVPDPRKRYGQHNSRVVFHEGCLPIGAAVYAKAAMDWLEKHSEDTKGEQHV